MNSNFKETTATDLNNEYEKIFEASKAILMDLMEIIKNIPQNELSSLWQDKPFPHENNFLWFSYANSKVSISYFSNKLPNYYPVSSENFEKINQFFDSYGFSKIETCSLQLDDSSTFKIFLGDLPYNYATITKILKSVDSINNYFKSKVICIDNTPITILFY